MKHAKANKNPFFEGSICSVRESCLNDYFKKSMGNGVTIAVIDSGWNYTLIDSRIQNGTGFVDPFDELCLKVNENYFDENGHGTAVTDLILRIAPGTTIIPLKVFGKRLETSVNILVEAILWSIKNKVKIINLSLGTLLDEALKPLYQVCELAKQNGIIIVSAQSNSNEYSYPSIFENSIGVKNGQLNSIFEIVYLHDEATECIAKGIHEDLLYLNGERVKSAGNSFAAPIITGLVALFSQNNNTLNLKEARKELENYFHFLQDKALNSFVS